MHADVGYIKKDGKRIIQLNEIIAQEDQKQQQQNVLILDKELIKFSIIFSSIVHKLNE